MNNKFDELAKGMAQSVTRRQAMKKFGVGLVGMALACFELRNHAEAAGNGSEKYLCCLYRVLQCGGGDCDLRVCTSAKKGCLPFIQDYNLISQTGPVQRCSECGPLGNVP